MSREGQASATQVDHGRRNIGVIITSEQRGLINFVYVFAGITHFGWGEQKRNKGRWEGGMTDGDLLVWVAHPKRWEMRGYKKCMAVPRF